MNVPITMLPHAAGLQPPDYASDESAGLDLRAATETPVTLQPGERSLIPVGFVMALPPGYEAQIRPRSGLALRHGITMLNAPGTIDSDYRGEVKVLAINHGNEPFVVEHGDRIAQMVIAPVTRVRLTQVDELTDTARGSGGFGSTGTL